MLYVGNDVCKDYADSCYCRNEKWLRIRFRFFTNVWLRLQNLVREKTQNPARVDSGKPDPWPHLVRTFSQNPIILIQCPVDGQWSIWTPWTPCIVMCGLKNSTRVRRCNAPEPGFGGKLCGDEEEQTVWKQLPLLFLFIWRFLLFRLTASCNADSRFHKASYSNQNCGPADFVWNYGHEIVYRGYASMNIPALFKSRHKQDQSCLCVWSVTLPSHSYTDRSLKIKL